MTLVKGTVLSRTVDIIIIDKQIRVEAIVNNELIVRLLVLKPIIPKRVSEPFTPIPTTTISARIRISIGLTKPTIPPITIGTISPAIVPSTAAPILIKTAPQISIIHIRMLVPIFIQITSVFNRRQLVKIFIAEIHVHQLRNLFSVRIVD